MTKAAELWSQSRAGQRRALAQLLTLAESDSDAYLEIAAQVHQSTRGALRVGFTGPAGAGKSTLIDAVVKGLRALRRKVAVLATDPTSEISGGALLGDRVRTTFEAPDPGLFFRSLGSRGARGGLSAAADDLLEILDACGFDRLLVEAAGAGQSETDIAHVVDGTIVVFQPGTGDLVQAMKAGLVEAGDLFVINKADLPGAELAAESLRSALALSSRTQTSPAPDVLLVSALENHGLDPLVRWIEQCAERACGRDAEESRRRDRLERRLKALLERWWTAELDRTLEGETLDRLFDRWRHGDSAHHLAAEIIARLQGPGGGTRRSEQR